MAMKDYRRFKPLNVDVRFKSERERKEHKQRVKARKARRLYLIIRDTQGASH